MATCPNCNRPFDGTPWDYRNGVRIHVNCDQRPPPKPVLSPGGDSAGPLPPASRSAVSHLIHPRPHRPQRAPRKRTPASGCRAAGQVPSGNRTIGKCDLCGRNVQSIDPHTGHRGCYRHVDCDAAGTRMDGPT